MKSVLAVALLAALSGIGAVAAQTYTLSVSLQEIGTIGTALGDRPFREAAPLIKKLEQQIQEQDVARAKETARPAEPSPEK